MDAQDSDGYIVFNLYIPLPHAMRLPGGLTFSGIVGQNGGEIDFSVEPSIIALPETLPALKNSRPPVLLARVLQTFQPSPTFTQLDTTLSMAAEAVGSEQMGERNASESAMATLVEVKLVSPVLVGSLQSKATAASESLGWAVDAVRQLQYGYRGIAKEPTQFLTRKNLPPVICVYRQTFYDSGVAFEEPGFALLETASGVLEFDGTDLLDLSDCRYIGRWATLDRPRELFDRAQLFGRNATDANVLAGDYRTVLLNAATAAESLLDDLLLFAFWWEELSPTDAAGRFTRNNLVKRIKSEYPSRFGGVWLPSSTGPVAEWHERIGRLRDRVVHGGYAPTKGEAERALEALQKLGKFVLRRLESANVGRKFPYMRALMVSSKEVEQSKQLKKERSEWYSGFPSPSEAHRNWRSIVTRYRVQSWGGSITPDVDDVVVYAVVDSNGFQHFAVDEQYAVAAPIKIVGLLARETALLQSKSRSLRKGDFEVLRFLDFGVKSRQLDGDWTSAEDVLPNYVFEKPK